MLPTSRPAQVPVFPTLADTEQDSSLVSAICVVPLYVLGSVFRQATHCSLTLQKAPTVSASSLAIAGIFPTCHDSQLSCGIISHAKTSVFIRSDSCISSGSQCSDWLGGPARDTLFPVMAGWDSKRRGYTRGAFPSTVLKTPPWAGWGEGLQLWGWSRHWAF